MNMRTMFFVSMSVILAQCVLLVVPPVVQNLSKVEPTTVPDPYTFTRVLVEEWRDDSLRFHATFQKHACDLNAFKAFGVFGDVTGQLKITDEDGYSDDENRTLGLHTLRLVVDVDPALWDVVEFRTRHVCILSDGTPRNVDKVFYVSRRP